MKTKTFIALVGTAFLAAGCTSTNPNQSKQSAAAEQAAAETQPFVAPNDPAMGQIVVVVPQVSVSAPAGAHFGNLGQTVRSQLTSTLSQSPNFLVADREILAEI